MKQQVNERWQLEGKKIVWDIKADSKLPHKDHLEMSGRGVSLYVEYDINSERELRLYQKIAWPTLRTIPNNTHASLMKGYENALIFPISIDGERAGKEKVSQVEFNGILTLIGVVDDKVAVIRSIFPARKHRVTMEEIVFKNTTNQAITLNLEAKDVMGTHRGVHGIYILDVKYSKTGEVILESNEEVTVTVVFSGRKIMEEPVTIDPAEEKAKRRAYIDEINSKLILETPEPILNQAFNFGKIRAAESIYDTQNGLMHGPGGMHYYAAVWTNDQAEYAGPFFPFLGNEEGIESSLNCYRLYRKFMGPDYKCIPTSIIAEGVDIWEGAGDRGDSAMYAYGAARFALTLGDRAIGEELWTGIEWCLEYCDRKRNKEGVIISDSDELEGRFETGEANLSTSSLTYSALKSSAALARELGKEESSRIYEMRAQVLEEAIENYFGGNVQGYDTYKYYKENEVLRAWICIPLAMGIMRRKDETIRAIFSSELWSDDGLATQAGDVTFWDRATLYALRGVFAAGETETAVKYLREYSARRTLGDHVPYAVEAYPEGDQRHLSAESALYCRIYTEGVFGITPTGFNTFACKPSMPDEWDKMALRKIHSCGKVFDLIVHQEDEKYIVTVVRERESRTYECAKGESITITIN